MNRGTYWTPEPPPISSGTRPPRRRARATRGLAGSLLGLAVGVGALLLLLAPARQSSALAPGAARPDEVLLALIAWAGVGLAAWLTLGSLLAVLALLPGGAGRAATHVAERVTPLAVRRLLTFTLGAAVGSCALPAAPVSSASSGPVTAGRGGSGPAAQDPGTTLLPGYAPTGGRAPRAQSPTDDALVRENQGPGFLPTLGQPASPRIEAPAPSWAAATSAPAPTRDPGYLPTAPPRVHDADRSRLLAPAPRIVASTHELVTVRRGDTLWSIVFRHLGSGASDVEVAHEWPRWFTANRTVIGEDPDLLVPGQQLRPPPSPGDGLGTEQSVDATAVVHGAGR